MKNITWLNGQGIDGVGSTKFMIEVSKQFEEIKIINFKSKFGNYTNGKNFDITGEITNTSDIFNELKDEKIIFINSFPNNKSTLEEINYFYKQLTQLSQTGIKLVGFMHFNTLAYLNRMPKILYGINLLDTIFTFNINSQFANEIIRFMPWKKNDLKEFGLPYEINLNLGLLKKENKMVYMGRYASFKKPAKMLDLVIDKIKYEYHGCGRTLETKQGLFIQDNVKYVNKTKPLPKFLNQETGLFEESNHEKGDILVHGVYKNEEGLKIMNGSKFAFSGFTLKPENYGNRFEYAMCEMINAQCICIFSKHFLDNVYISGKSLSYYNIFLGYDFENPDQIKAKIKQYLEDDNLYIKTIQNQHKALKILHNPETIVGNILKNINKSENKIYSYVDFLEKLFNKTILIENVLELAIEPADLKRKDHRKYVQKNTRLTKIIYE